jgi:hypothetical protein
MLNPSLSTVKVNPILANTAVTTPVTLLFDWDGALTRDRQPRVRRRGPWQVPYDYMGQVPRWDGAQDAKQTFSASEFDTASKTGYITNLDGKRTYFDLTKYNVVSSERSVYSHDNPITIHYHYLRKPNVNWEDKMTLEKYTRGKFGVTFILRSVSGLTYNVVMGEWYKMCQYGLGRGGEVEGIFRFVKHGLAIGIKLVERKETNLI